MTGDYKEIPYLRNVFSPIYQDLLLLLDADINEELFWKLANSVKRVAGLK